MGLKTVNGRLIINSLGKLLTDLCACLCGGRVPLICCDSFAACIDVDTPIKKALFANVFVYDDVLMTTLLANFTIPVNYMTGIDYNSGFFRDGWYGCEARDPVTECFTWMTVFLQCESTEFKITANGFACDGTVQFTGTSGTIALQASPFIISSTGVSIASTSCGTVFVVVDISE